MDRLPSLRALELLALVARFESISRAAERAGLTQSAASRRIAALEADLGVSLLERRRYGVTLTPEGREFLARIETPVAEIARAAAEMRAGETRLSGSPLRLRVYSTFAARWLLPRLPDFERRHPGIRVRIDTTVTPASPERGKVDLAIQFGDGRAPGTSAWLLMADEIEPVCTPGFSRQHDIGPETRTLPGTRLLDSRYRRADWQDWAEAVGCDLGDIDRMVFPSSLLAFQAAVEGLGLAMGQTRFLTNEFADGVLVRPFAKPLRRPLGYYLMAPRGSETAQARAFRRWIMATATT